jgi:hypothetical protein
MRRSSPLVAPVALGLALGLGACADLIGANFGEFQTEPSGSGGSGSTGSAGSSTATATATASTSGSGGSPSSGSGGAGGGAPPSSTSSSTGTGGDSGCGWPAGSGEWRWAQAFDAGSRTRLDALEVVGVTPSAKPGFPWTAVGNFIGVLDAGPAPPFVGTRPSPFVVSLGPNGVDVDGVESVPCTGDCIDAAANDATAQPSLWESFGPFLWAAGSYRGAFHTFPEAVTESPWLLRIAQTEPGLDWQLQNSWNSVIKGTADQATF